MPTWVWPILFGAAVTGIVGFFVNMHNRLRQLELDVAIQGTKVSPLWAQVQARLTEDLHHDDPKYHAADKLIDKLVALTITLKERRELKNLLAERVVDPHVSEMESKKAKALIAVMDIVLIESESTGEKLVNTVLSLLVGSSMLTTYIVRNWR